MENVLTKEQGQKLREVLRRHERETLITLALVTGMRRDELLRLRWQDIDLEKREMRVQSTKTKTSTRIIHCSEGLTELLKRHRLCQRAALSEANGAWSDLDPVFPNPAGGFLKPEQLLQEFSEILEQAALPHLRFHDLRRAWWRALRARFQARKDGPASTQEAILTLMRTSVLGSAAKGETSNAWAPLKHSLAYVIICMAPGSLCLFTLLLDAKAAA